MPIVNTNKVQLAVYLKTRLESLQIKNLYLVLRYSINAIIIKGKIHLVIKEIGISIYKNLFNVDKNSFKPSKIKKGTNKLNIRNLIILTIILMTLICQVYFVQEVWIKTINKEKLNKRNYLQAKVQKYTKILMSYFNQIMITYQNRK